MTPDQGQRIIELLEDILTAIKANGSGGGVKNASGHKDGVFDGWKAARVPMWAKFDGGIQFGDLSGKALAFWLGYQPKGYQGAPPKAEDVALRKLLDQAQADVSSGAWVPPQYTNKPKDPSKAKPNPAAPTEAEHANQCGPDDGSDVPY
jgi:hypothetical protein